MQAGVDLGGTKLLILLEDDGGARTVHRLPTGPAFGPAELTAALKSVLPPGTLTGIAIPGLVDATGHIVESDVLPRLNGWNPVHAGLAAIAMNDGEAALSAFAAAFPPDATLAVVGAGTGTAAALQVAGVTLRRHRPLSGELGLAPFGHDGTLDDHASGAAILRAGATPESIARAGAALGVGLATLVHIVHPEAIGLYGGALRHPGYLDAAHAELRRRALPALLAQTRVSPVDDPDTVAARGALREARRK